MTSQYDLIIVGGGAAGLTAAIYASRRELKTLVISQDIGGQAATTPDIENYPGVDFTDGVSLMQKFYAQAQKHGALFSFAELEKIEKSNNGFTVRTNVASYEGRAVILAFGLTHRHLNVPGELELIGHGVAYCATCDAPFYRGKKVAVVGNGVNALETASLLSKIANTVYVVTKHAKLLGPPAKLETVLRDEKIIPVLETTILSITGNGRVSALQLSKKSGPEDLPIDGVFVELGFQARGEVVKNLVALDEKMQIIINRDCETSMPGIFAAGDISDIKYKQVVISASEGAKAALQAYSYLHGDSNGRVGTDWGVKKT